MSDATDKHRAAIDAYADLIADITGAPSEAAIKRLRAAAASALRTQLAATSSVSATGQPARAARSSTAGIESARTALRAELSTPDDIAEPLDAVLAVVRRDQRDLLTPGSFITSFTGLTPQERLGPFTTYGGTDIWFDLFFAAQQLVVRETGGGAPVIVCTQAGPPTVVGSGTTVKLEAGTVWIRGDLILPDLPANAFVGLKISGGLLELHQPTSIVPGIIEISSALRGLLHVRLASDQATLTTEGGTAANATVSLPESLRLLFDTAVASIGSSDGQAEVWGQTFSFGPITGTRTFVEPLWTVVLGCQIRSTVFDAASISSDLLHAEGRADIIQAGLGLPVVTATNPALLGEVANPASWLLQLRQMKARWYQPDLPLHALGELWINIAAANVTLLAERVAPLVVPVAHAYSLWTVSGGSQQRLPWLQTYPVVFPLLYQRDGVNGEALLIYGQASVVLDRPVTTSGQLIPTPAIRSAVLLSKLGDKTSVVLGAEIAPQNSTYQLALQNALVWATAPESLIVQGTLVNSTQIDSGAARILMGAYAWVPTLPDPYVSNSAIRRPEGRPDTPPFQLIGTIRWSRPDQASVGFEGSLSGGLAVDERRPSSDEPRPTRSCELDPPIGPTQVEQDRLSFDEPGTSQWRNAQGDEANTRSDRVPKAQIENAQSVFVIDSSMAELLGPAPNLLLLDVSTNQDLLGVGFHAQPSVASEFAVADLAVHSRVADVRVIALPQVQWEPVRTLDPDQNILTMGWFPTPLASASDGGATQIGAHSQKLTPIIPEATLNSTFDAFKDGAPVGIRTTFPFGLISAIQLQPQDSDAPKRKADLYGLTRPTFPDEDVTGGLQITAFAEGGRPDSSGVSPTFKGQMRQLLNGVDLASGAPLGISVLGETLKPEGSVEYLLNSDLASNPRVPVTRIDLSGYGGSNFSDWNDPFAAYAQVAKVQFQVVVGRTALEVIKVNSVLHPWGIRVTRSVTIERRSGGGVIRRDSGWQAITPGIFDYRYRYIDERTNEIRVAPYAFDAGVFRGLFNVRTIRPAPGQPFRWGGNTQLVPYYFDADVAFEGVLRPTASRGLLGYLQIMPNGEPTSPDALKELIERQGPVGGPVDVWMDVGRSGLLFRAQRVEVGLAMDDASPLFVATVRGNPALPKTGAWSVAVRPVANVPPNGGEAVPVAENRGVPLTHRYPVKFPDDTNLYGEPRLDPAAVPGDYRFADAADLLRPTTPANEYALVQSTPTHAFLFPRPIVPSAGIPRIESGDQPALADIFARSTSKGAFPPARNTIQLPSGSLHFNVSQDGKLALSSPITISGHPTPLQLGGSSGHGSTLFYDNATIGLKLEADRWEAKFDGLRIWSDIAGLKQLTGIDLRIVGSTEQRPQIAEFRTLILKEIEEILRYIPLFGDRGVQGPLDLGASNAKHEFKVEAQATVKLPPKEIKLAAGVHLEFQLLAKTGAGFDAKLGSPKVTATLSAGLEGRIPLYSVGVAAIFLTVALEIAFNLTALPIPSGVDTEGKLNLITKEQLELTAFVGVGVEGRIGPFSAYAFLGVGFVLSYDGTTKYGGLVALEAGVDLKLVNVKIRAELKGLVYKDARSTKCDYSGSVLIHVDIFFIFSINASYEVSDTTTF